MQVRKVVSMQQLRTILREKFRAHRYCGAVRVADFERSFFPDESGCNWNARLAAPEMVPPAGSVVEEARAEYWLAQGEVDSANQIITAEGTDAYRLKVEFSDGLFVEVDLEPILNGQLYGPLRDPWCFAEFAVDPATQALRWPNGAYFEGEVLRHWPGTAEVMANLARTCAEAVS